MVAQKWNVPVTLTLEAASAEEARQIVSDVLAKGGIQTVAVDAEAVEAEERYTEPCPICLRDVEVVDTDSVPSMLGYGSDDSTTLACGHVLTYDPFTGQAHARPSTFSSTQQVMPDSPIVAIRERERRGR
jgi:hypothetical protein